jgi:prevent-host-death family protein
MKPEKIAISELRQRLSEVVHAVGVVGRTVVITQHGRPIARLVPITSKESTDE